MRQHTAESPSVHDQFSDANVTTYSVHDDVFHAPDYDAIAAEAEYRATHCEQCGGVTPGTLVADVHMQLCDRCLVAALREALILIESQVA